jgi:hypothetical protein
MVKFRDVLWRWGAGELSMMEAGELLGTSKRQFLQYRDRFEEDGEEWPRDRRLGKPSPKRGRRRRRIARRRSSGRLEHQAFQRTTPARSRLWLGYSWVKVQLHAAGLVGVRRGTHCKRCEGVMLHQEGSHAVWLAGEPTLDLTVTIDDATSTIPDLHPGPSTASRSLT